MLIPCSNVREPPAPNEERSFQEAERREGTAVWAVPLVTSDDDESTNNATEDRNTKRRSHAPLQCILGTYTVRLLKKADREKK